MIWHLLLEMELNSKYLLRLNNLYIIDRRHNIRHFTHELLFEKGWNIHALAPNRRLDCFFKIAQETDSKIFVIASSERSGSNGWAIHCCTTIWQTVIASFIRNWTHMKSEFSCFPRITQSWSAIVWYGKIPRHTWITRIHLKFKLEIFRITVHIVKYILHTFIHYATETWIFSFG